MAKRRWGRESFPPGASARGHGAARSARGRAVPSFPCDDYFADGWADRGFEEWLTIGQEELLITQIVVRSSAVEETLPGAGTGPPEPLLRIGGPGVDGLDFVYRREHPGLWIYAPIGKTLVQAAASVTDLTDRYADGRLSL